MKEKYLYHGLYISIGGDEHVLEQIFSSGYLLTRESLKNYLSNNEYNIFDYFHHANWNGSDAISVACHPQDKELIEKYDIKEIDLPRWKSAYNEYILERTTILVLDKKILEDFNIKEESNKMSYELQIKGDIPISYIKAIAINIKEYETFTPDKIFKLKKALNELK